MNFLCDQWEHKSTPKHAHCPECDGRAEDRIVTVMDAGIEKSLTQCRACKRVFTVEEPL